MRKLSLLLMIFGLLLVGCDSDSNGGDDSSDADTLVGTWAVTGLTDASGDRSQGLLESYNSVLITLGADNTLSMNVDAKDPVPDLNATGTFQLNESTKALSATISVGGQATPLTFTYGIVGESGLTLTPTGSTTILLGALFQTSYSDPVEFTFTKVN